MTWKKKSINLKLKNLCQLKSNVKNNIKKECYCIVWSVETIETVKDNKVVKTKNGRIMLLLKCKVCNSNKSKFMKEQKASKILSDLWIKTS